MTEFVTSMIAQSGYLGLFFLMFLENIFPPIPSEVVMPLAGYVAAEGTLNIIVVAIVGALGAVVGALPWYYLGYYFNQDRLKRLAGRYGRVLTVHPSDIDRASAWFERRGKVTVFLGRFVPIFRTIISVPAGIVRMSLVPFLIYTFLGSLIWAGGLAIAGYILRSNFKEVAVVLDPIVTGILIVIVGTYIYRFVTFKKDVETDTH